MPSVKIQHGPKRKENKGKGWPTIVRLTRMEENPPPSIQLGRNSVILFGQAEWKEKSPFLYSAQPTGMRVFLLLFGPTEWKDGLPPSIQFN